MLNAGPSETHMSLAPSETDMSSNEDSKMNVVISLAKTGMVHSMRLCSPGQEAVTESAVLNGALRVRCKKPQTESD